MLPTRGARGRPGLGAPEPGRGPAGAVGDAAGAASTWAAGGGGAAGAGAAGAGVGATGAAAAGASGAALAGAFFAGAGAGALPPPNDSRNRRATGASTVDDADLTNSPCSLSRVRTSLLVTPSSFANSCTRALPAATTSPSLEATAVVHRASGLATTHGHRDFTVCSCSSLPLSFPGGRAIRCARPPRWCPVNRRCATLGRKLAAGSPPSGSDHRGAARHPGPGGSLPCRRRRPAGRSPSTRPPSGAVRQPALASGSRCTCAPERCGAQRPKLRAGSRLSLASPARSWRTRYSAGGTGGGFRCVGVAADVDPPAGQPGG